ncbi:MFS transporter [Streptomyces triticagri]|uniref:MFS transporter n=2 Tax=Streptomyces triticagri TaxID=2293568 RepID=A0A372M516_9ACTN|nr:MFS transporter [Streptomyces triticagri]
MMVNFADKAVLGLAAEEIRADLDLTATQFGLANSAFFLMFSVAGAAVGLLADRVSLKWLLLVMALLWSVAQVPTALGGGLGVLIATRVLLGAAEGPAFPVAQQAALSWFPDHRRNLPGALITLGVTLGVITAAPGLSWVIQHHGWRAALWVVAAAGLVWAVAWFLLGADGRHRDATAPTDTVSMPIESPACTAGSPESAVPPPLSYRRIFASRTWIGTTVAYFTSYWAVALMLVWLPSQLRHGLGHSASAAGTLVVLPWALGAAVLLGQAALTGRLMRRGVSSRIARGRVGAGLLLVGATGCLGFPLADGVAMKTAFLIVGLGFGGAFATVAITSVTELAPASRRGGALGTMNAVVTTSGLLAPAVVGSLVDAQGSGGYQNSVVLTGLILLVGALAAYLLIDPARDAVRTSARRHL